MFTAKTIAHRIERACSDIAKNHPQRQKRHPRTARVFS